MFEYSTSQSLFYALVGMILMNDFSLVYFDRIPQQGLDTVYDGVTPA
jgi:hypothetical protein